MNKFFRYLFIHKIFVFNSVLAVLILIYPPFLFKLIGDKTDLHYYLSVALLSVMFLEFAGIYYKTHFIYARKEARDGNLPLAIKFSFFPRVFLAGIIMMLVFRGMGWLEQSDFWLLLIVAYAVLKEFWVRNNLMNTKSTEGIRINQPRVWTSEVFLFLYVFVTYICAWEFYLVDHPKLLKMMEFPTNYIWFGLIFLTALILMEVPYLVEENFRDKSKEQKRISIFSFLFPLLAFLFVIYRIGFKV